MADGAVGTRRDLTGHGNQLAELFGSEVTGRTGAGRVLEPDRDRDRGVGLHRSGGQPPVAPEAGGIDADGEIASNLGIVATLGSGLDDASAQDELLRRGGTADQGLQRLLFSSGETNQRRFGATGRPHGFLLSRKAHDDSPDPLLQYPRLISAGVY